jgi:hypothetical protein
MIIPFGEYLPDLPAFNNPGATVAKNVVPAGDSYLPFLSQSVYSNALTARCQGAFSTKDADGNTVNFAGDATKLYRMASAAYADVSLAGGYTTGTDEMWYFTRFNNRLLATNFNDAIQTFTVNSSSNFANLAAGAPKARYIATVRNFVVVGNTFDAVDGNVPSRVRWCGLDDPTSWIVSATTQADYQDLDVSKGWVRQVVGGEYGTIFQEHAISRMTYVGSPVIWQFDEVESGRGCPAPGGVVKAGNIIFYLGNDGFYAFDGTSSIPIGVNKVDKTFWNEVDLSYLSRITATADYDQQIIYWAYPATGNTNGRSNKILCYNYSPNAKKRWSTVEGIDIELIYNSISEGYTLDSLDTISTNLDSLSFSLDSRVWTGENFLLSGFDSSHRQINFTGSAMTAVLETGEMQLYPDNRADVTLVRPVVDGSSATCTVQMGTRNTQTSSYSYASAVAANSTGNCPVRSNARYHRIRANVSGGFNHAIGVELVKAAKAGER